MELDRENSQFWKYRKNSRTASLKCQCRTHRSLYYQTNWRLHIKLCHVPGNIAHPLTLHAFKWLPSLFQFIPPRLPYLPHERSTVVFVILLAFFTLDLFSWAGFVFFILESTKQRTWQTPYKKPILGVFLAGDFMVWSTMALISGSDRN